MEHLEHGRGTKRLCGCDFNLLEISRLRVSIFLGMDAANACGCKSHRVRRALNLIKPRRITIKTLSLSHIVKSALAVCAIGCSFAATGSHAIAGDTTSADDKLSTPAVQAEAPSRIHVFIQNDFSDKYLTPRGLLVENEGVVWQPLAILLIDLYSADHGFLTDATLAPGNWASVHSHRDGPQLHNWNEDDPFIGLNLKFFKDFELDSTYTAFVSENGSFPTSTNLDEKLTYHDHFIDGFSINPYVEYFDELTNKSTFVINPATSKKGYYFVLGMDPTYTVKTPVVPITFELPTYVSLCSSNFYQRLNGTGGGAGVGVVTTEIKASVPIDFIPKSYGHWTYYAGFQYYYIANQGALDGNATFGAAAGSREHDLYQFHTGVQLFF